MPQQNIFGTLISPQFVTVRLLRYLIRPESDIMISSLVISSDAVSAKLLSAQSSSLQPVVVRIDS